MSVYIVTMVGGIFLLLFGAAGVALDSPGPWARMNVAIGGALAAISIIKYVA